AGPIALLLATGLGYLLAGAGLRAVDAMRRRAEEISADRPGERLPVPRTRDELERLGETLNEMLARLEAALERERGFVAEAGHELRTPLALLRAQLDFALHHGETEADLREAVRGASEETDRLVQLAGDLLLIAGSDQGRVPLARLRALQPRRPAALHRRRGSRPRDRRRDRAGPRRLGLGGERRRRARVDRAACELGAERRRARRQRGTGGIADSHLGWTRA